MAVHATLTDPELHEPKGASTASANTVYRANGSGGGSWGLIGAASVNTLSVFNLNKILLSASMEDIGTVATVYIPVPYKADVTAVTATLQAAITGANTTLTISNNGGTSMGTIVFPTAGSAAGATASNSSLTNNSFTAGQTVRITTDGAATNAVPVVFAIELTLT